MGLVLKSFVGLEYHAAGFVFGVRRRGFPLSELRALLE
jgi:hypothetical protein